jgi:hypothetical protein
MEDWTQHDAWVPSYNPEIRNGMYGTTITTVWDAGGYNYEDDSGQPDQVFAAALMQWDINIPAGDSISSVEKAILLLRPSGQLADTKYRLYRLIETFDEATVCYNNRPARDPNFYVTFTAPLYCNSWPWYVDVSALLAENGDSSTFGIEFELAEDPNSIIGQIYVTMISSEYTGYSNAEWQIPRLDARFVTSGSSYGQGYFDGDINTDYYVNPADISEMALNWAACTDPNDCQCDRFWK